MCVDLRFVSFLRLTITLEGKSSESCYRIATKMTDA